MPEFSMPSWGQMMDRISKSSIFPSKEAMKAGAEQALYSKEPVVLSDYRVEVFDMSMKLDRDKYTSLMKELVPKVQAAKCVIAKNELQVMKDGWWRYVEWFEYKLNDSSTTTVIPNDDAQEDSSESHENVDDEDLGANIY